MLFWEGGYLFAAKCNCVYVVSYKREVISFLRKAFKEYCFVKAFPDFGLFTCSLKQDEQKETALAIIDLDSVAIADDKDFLELGKIFSFNKVFYLESSGICPRVPDGFKNQKTNLIPFPCDIETIKNQIFKTTSLIFEKKEFQETVEVPAHLKRFAGNSTVVKSLRNNFLAFGQTDLPLILQGESGTGKTFAAELIHSVSSRKGSKFRRINMPCVQEEIVESEFFGTVQGAFTGAVNKKGILEETNGGTVLFDEISEIPLRFQAKLLKFLDSGNFNRVGSCKESHVDVRVICATNANLEELVDKKLFRRDLYERLKGKVITLPALNTHKEDIAVLVENFLLEKGYSSITFSQEAIKSLEQRDWVGNVRELQYCIELTCSLTNKKIIGPEDLVFAS